MSKRATGPPEFESPHNSTGHAAALRLAAAQADRRFAAVHPDPKVVLTGRRRTIVDMNSTLILSATGIIVSGVVGPAISGWAARRADAQRFNRDQRGKHREDLRMLVDEAAALLAVGATNLRQIREARKTDREEPDEVRDWASNVHALQQRLLLRVAPYDLVTTTYRDVRDALVTLDRPNGVVLEEAVRDFEQKRLAFLAAARASLEKELA